MGNPEITNAELLNILAQKIDDKFNFLSKSIEDSTANINKKLMIATKTILNLKKNNQDLRERVINLENKIRRNNIAVFGLESDKNNLLESSISKLNTALKVQVLSKSDISNIYWPQNKSSNTPVIFELITNFKKLEVFGKIKESLESLKEAKVFITNDLSYEERQVRKFLKEKQIELKKDNKDAKITGRALIVDGQKIHYKELLQTEVDYSESDLESVSEYETELLKEIANENDTTDLKKRKSIHSPLHRVTRYSKKKK